MKSISQKFTFAALITFAIPSILMMILMALYQIVDGIFISRLVGSNALSATNIVWPVICIVIAVGTMLEDGMMYLRIILLFSPACLLQSLYQSWMVTAGKPGLGLFFTVFAACANMFFDYYFIAFCGMGVAGAAYATGIGQMLPAVSGSFYFACNRGALHFCKFRWNFKDVLFVCYNGSSEMVTQLSNAVVTFLFNIIMMRLVGETGVAAITILLYAQFLFNAFYMGFSIGVAPVLGYQYGAQDKRELRRLYRMITAFVAVSSFVITAASLVMSDPLLHVFTKDAQTFQLASQGFRLFALSFLFSGINIIFSGIFTALSNGRASAIISLARTLVFTVESLLILPSVLGLTGVWLAVPCAELFTIVLCAYFHCRYFTADGVYFRT